MSEVDMSQLSGVAETSKMAVRDAWHGVANKEASDMAGEIGKQEGMRARIGQIGERLKKIKPSNNIAEKAKNFLTKQANKEDKKAAKFEGKQVKAETKAANLTTKAESQTAKVDKLSENVARRIKSAEQAKNMQMYAEKNGINVKKIKDGTSWFDRVILATADKIRISWNETLAETNSRRAEGQLANAMAYKTSAEQLRNAANALRSQFVEGITSGMATASADRTKVLEGDQSLVSEQLKDSSDRAAVAAARLGFSRDVMPGLGETAAADIQPNASAKDAAKVTEDFYNKAGQGLESAGQSTGSTTTN